MKKNKNFLTLMDFDKDQIYQILKLSKKLKKNRLLYKNLLYKKSIGLIFSKSSTRTRISFQVAIEELGGNSIFLSKNDMQIGRGETLEHTGKVLSRYLEGIIIRTSEHSNITDLANHFDKTVVNGLSDSFHPCQTMADFLTILEIKKKINNLKIAYVGDGNNVANSLAIGCHHLNLNCVIATPKKYQCPPEIMDYCKKSKVKFTDDPYQATHNTDVIYTDTWISMGQEKETNKRKKIFNDYQVNKTLVSKAKKDYIFLHCMPIHLNEEVTEEIVNSHHSKIYDQAENRLHTQKAVLSYLMK